MTTTQSSHKTCTSFQSLEQSRLEILLIELKLQMQIRETFMQSDTISPLTDRNGKYYQSKQNIWDLDKMDIWWSSEI